MVDTVPLNIQKSNLLIYINPGKVLIPKLLNSLCFKCVYGGPIFDYIVGLPGNVTVQYLESDNGFIAGVYRINGKIVDFRGCNRIPGDSPAGEGITWVINEDYKFTVQKSKDFWHITYHNTPHWISDRTNNIPILPTEADNLTKLQIETLYLPHQYRNHKPVPKPHYKGLEDILDELYSLLGGHGVEIHCHPDDFFGWIWTRPKGNPDEVLKPPKRPQPTRCWATANSGMETGDVMVKDLGISGKPRATQKIANLLISDFDKFNLAGVAILQDRIRLIENREPMFQPNFQPMLETLCFLESMDKTIKYIGTHPVDHPKEIIYPELRAKLLIDNSINPGVICLVYSEGVVEIGIRPNIPKVDFIINDIEPIRPGQKTEHKKLKELINGLLRGQKVKEDPNALMTSLRHQRIMSRAGGSGILRKPISDMPYITLVPVLPPSEND